MKQITKSSEPALFSDWKQQNIPLGMGYGDLHGNVKGVLHAAIMQEQGWICCYCEDRIGQDDSHIDHFCPQKGVNACPNQTLDYQNLLASWQRTVLKRPERCGMLKGDWFNVTLLISPLNPGCENRFRYAADGAISPANPQDQVARVTIDKLGLDIDKLRALRASALQALEDLPRDKVQKILDHPISGQFQPFYTTIRKLLT